jgi:hypothetical protein
VKKEKSEEKKEGYVNSLHLSGGVSHKNKKGGAYPA